METFEQYGINIPYRRGAGGNVKCICPECVKAGTRTHLTDRSLSVNIDKGEWFCHYCGWKGHLNNSTPYIKKDKPKKVYRRPVAKPMTELSRQLVAYFDGRGISELTLKKMRVGEGLCFMPQAGKKMNTVQFNYYLNGELVNIKYRTGNKLFMLEKDAELIPYNIDAIADRDECVITEGEIDCLSFVEIGIDNCISVPNGASNNLSYLDEFVEGWLDDKQTIYIASDTDEKGSVLRDELIRRFGGERCKIITYGEGCKDANECLVKYGRAALEKCFREAKDVGVEGIYHLPDYEDELDKIWEFGLQRGFTIGHPDFDRLCSFETKRLCIVTGIPSSGKSEFIDEMVVRINVLYGYRVGFFSPENMPFAYHAVKLIEKLCGRRMQKEDDGTGNNITPAEYSEAKEYMTDNFYHILPEDSNSIEAILDKASYLVRKYGIRILVLDPYNRIEKKYKEELDNVPYILNKVRDFAYKHDALVFLMAHPTKIRKDTNGDGIPTLYDVSGSADWYNMADFGITVHRFRGDNDKQYTLVRVTKVKFRNLGENGDAKFKFDTVNGRYADWDGSSAEVLFDRNSYLHSHGQKGVNAALSEHPAMPPCPTSISLQGVNDSDLPFNQPFSNECPF